MSSIITVGNIPRPSLWDKPAVADGNLPDLRGTAFKLMGGRLRPVTTRYGDNTAVDLIVEIDGESFTYSGFSAGIAAQIRTAQNADFPTFATIEEISLSGNRTTTTLIPVKPDDLPAPVRPESQERDGQLPTANDDDIPF